MRLTSKCGNAGEDNPSHLHLEKALGFGYKNLVYMCLRYWFQYVFEIFYKVDNIIYK